MQSDHLVAFEGRKLSGTEQRYLVHEKEMTTVVHYLWTWRHYLLGSHFTIFTDNMTASCFTTQKKLTSEQARWQDFLIEFDFTLHYNLGHMNMVADALS